MRFKWIKDKGRFANGDELYLGDVTMPVAGVHWTSLSRNAPEDAPRYKATCTLPGIKNDLGNYPTEEKAKEKAENTVKFWINKAGLTNAPQQGMERERRGMKKGTYIYWINECGEHIPGIVLAVGKKIKVRINDLTGNRITWVTASRLEVQS